MKNQLIGLSREHRGKAWLLASKPLLFGRGRDCDVFFTDTTVSRKQCQIVVEGGKARLEDLGSRNKALVNGIPVETKRLEVGDEISVGSGLFLFARASSGQVLEIPHAEGTADTVSWGNAGQEGHGAPYLVLNGDKRPRSVQDLASLLDAVCQFSGCSSLGELIGCVRSRLHERFGPGQIWTALLRGDDTLMLLGDDRNGASDGPADVVLEHMKKVLRDAESIRAPLNAGLSASPERQVLLASPVTVGGACEGVLAVEKNYADRGANDDADLRYLALMGQCLGPLLRTVESTDRLRRERTRFMTKAGESQDLLGVSRKTAHVRNRIAAAARTDIPVLILGETGTGKELAVRRLHDLSPRHAFPLIIINCAAIPRELFEGELFGYEKGAFTGADRATDGLLHQAHGGTLFLDEIGDLSLDNQARILRVMENHTFRKIGGKKELHVDMRVVAATNRDLREAMGKGEFREDLYHRIAGVEITLPPLKQRPSDIPLLAQRFLEMYRGEAKRPLKGISPEAVAYLQSRAWSGNVRELRNAIQRAVAIAGHEELEVDDFQGLAPRDAEDGASHGPFLPMIEVEKRHIAGALRRCGGNIPEAAELLGIGRSTLYKKIIRYEL